jgi:DNA-directed RNA polymerase subunit RPC12/RpoP
MKMDPTFVEKDKKTRKAVVQKLRSAIVVVCKACKNVMTEAAFKSNGDKCTANKGTPCDPTQIGRESELAYAEENWADWAKNDPDKVTAFLTRILKEQCKTMGHDGPPLYYCQDCGKRFEPAQLVTPGNKCPDCNSTNLLGPDTVKVVLAQGGVDPGLDPGDYADATPTVPALIRFNKTHAGFNDFKEVLDTILHENSHAWQNMLVEKLKKSPPFTQADADGILNDPNLKAQAEFFLENDATYITSGVSPEAYRHEPLEEQAWSFGGNASRDLLVPPAVRSFQSKRGQKNKVLFIESVKRAAKAVVRLRTRHGIYASEWEGENPQDKKVVVEGVTGLNGATTVRQVIDEYTLEINRDSSALPRVKADHTVVEAELKKRAKLVTCAACTKEMTVEEFDTNGKKCTANLATACDPTKIKRVAELPNDKRNILLREIAVAKNFDATESEGMVVLRDKTSEFAEVERGRVILDESVTAMT